MAGHESDVELMRKYPIPQTSEDVNKYSFIGYGLFIGFLAVITALALYFAN